MGVKWTDEQRSAIETRGCNILLSAAAGSGKTATLVERIRQMVTAGDTDIDRLLVVTFSRAASADMRAKMAKTLEEGARAGDTACREQLLLLERASFSTVHGFCSEFLRTHFDTANVDPSFRVMDENEAEQLLTEAINEAVKDAYADYADTDSAIHALDYGRHPKKVRSIIRDLIRAMEEQPDPKKWLHSACDVSEDMLTLWMDELMKDAKRGLRKAIEYYREAEKHGQYGSYPNALINRIRELDRLLSIAGFSELAEVITVFNKSTNDSKSPLYGRKSEKKDTVDEYFYDLIDSAKAASKELCINKYRTDRMRSDIDSIRPQLKCLEVIALNALQKYEAAKQKRCALSYSDLEHRTLETLRDSDTARQELRERYDFVFVDEYQDTSRIQEDIILNIAKPGCLFAVGDVKQSIYRFRQAEPFLFLKKLSLYKEDPSEGHANFLTMNFRSRKEVLDFTNAVFKRCMYAENAEIDYTDDDMLNAAPDGAVEHKLSGHVSVHLLSGDTPVQANTGADETNDEEASEEKSDSDLTPADLAVCEAQALFIAERIKALRKEHPELTYKDFAILTRTKSNVLGPMANILTQQGIPAYADGSTGFYQSAEITLALSLLKLITNRRSDIELIGVLRSPVVGLSDEELARIRIEQLAQSQLINENGRVRPSPFCDAVQAYRSYGDDTAKRLNSFYAKLDDWKLLSMSTDLGTLVRTVNAESGLYTAVTSMPAGRQRQANLDRLAVVAAAYDSSVSGSLTRFLGHTDKLKQKGGGDDAHLLGENDDVVRLMTVHKSKGLEFTVVFGAMMDRSFNKKGGGEVAARCHRDLGFSIRYYDRQTRSSRDLIVKDAINLRAAFEDRAEELRILYVLLTRAKDRLELVGNVVNAETAKKAWQLMPPSESKSYLDIIMPAMLNSPVELCDIQTHPVPAAFSKASDDINARIESLLRGDVSAEALTQALEWSYPCPEDPKKPLKLTVTGLVHELHGPETVASLEELPSFEPIPEEGPHMSGTERGTAYHRVMECLDFVPLRGLGSEALLKEIMSQMDRMVNDAKLTLTQREAVFPSRIARFIQTDVGQRLINAEEVHREWCFNARVDMRGILTEEEIGSLGAEKIMMQGVIDCCFVENGQWVVLDYKTDRNSDHEALRETYKNQLRIYASALKAITGKDTRGIYLCLLMGEENVEISLNG